MARRPARTCHAAGCQAAIGPGKLMCRTHWYALPWQLRTEINASWREKRIRDWSANCLEARRLLSGGTATPLAPRVSAQEAFERNQRMMGER